MRSPFIEKRDGFVAVRFLDNAFERGNRRRRRLQRRSQLGVALLAGLADEVGRVLGEGLCAA
jgi:hypothetical protein